VAITIRTTPAGRPEEEIRTVNLSASGVCYDSPRWVEPLTRLEMAFVFADSGPENVPTDRLVDIEAVVVRCDPPEETKAVSSYRVACFFTAIGEEDRAFIDNYVRRILESSTTSA